MAGAAAIGKPTTTADGTRPIATDLAVGTRLTTGTAIGGIRTCIAADPTAIDLAVSTGHRTGTSGTEFAITTCCATDTAIETVSIEITARAVTFG